MTTPSLMTTLCNKLLKCMLRFLFSLSWSNITFIFCLYVFFDAVRNFMHLARRQNATKRFNSSSAMVAGSTTTSSGRSTARQKKSKQRARRPSRSAKNPPQHVPPSSDPDSQTSPSQITVDSSNIRNVSNASLQTPAVESSASSLPCNTAHESVDGPSNNNNDSSRVKRYVALFSGMNPTSSAPALLRQIPDTATQRSTNPLQTNEEHQNDNHGDLDHDNNNDAFLGDVDERVLRNNKCETRDAKLGEMTIVLSKRLVGVSVPELFDTCWTQAPITSGSHPFYETWLQRLGYTNIVIHDWEYATKDGDLRGRWCGENYSQRRLVSFNYRRTSDLHCGCLDAEVRQVQMCRMDGNNKLVVRMRTDTRGVPFADCFQTEVRMVVTQSDTKDIWIKVGVVVDFLKPVVLAGKLQSELLQDITYEQLDFFKYIKNATRAHAQQIGAPKENHDNFNLQVVFMSFLKQWDQK